MDVESHLCLLVNANKALYADIDIAQWIVTLFIVTMLTVILLMLTFCYMYLGTKVWKVMYGAAARASTKKRSPGGIIKVAVLLLSSYVSHIPMLITYIMAMAGSSIGDHNVTWVFLATTCVCSVLHPLLFTKWEIA